MHYPALFRPACLALLLAVAGCSGGGGTLVPVQAEGGADKGASSPHTYTVQRGDSLYGIARQFNMTVRALIDANSLQPPFQVIVGQVLVLPGGGDYVVVKGDTLMGVAHKTGVSFSTLARMNNLAPPYVVKLGQRLLLPAAVGQGTTQAALPPVIEAQRKPPPTKRADASPSAKKVVGGYAPLSQRSQETNTQPPPAALPSAAAASAPAPVPGPVPSPASAAAPLAAAPSVPSPPAMPAALMPVTANAGRGFIWPVRGQVITEYGSAGKGQHNDGINIAVPRGTPVLAAQDGVVAYAGNELKGFGNLLLVKHADGWMTAYAHNEALLVKRGQSVRRGQQIAKSGDSGGVAEPQLHFEVRQGTRAVDPMSYLVGANPTASPGTPPGSG